MNTLFAAGFLVIVGFVANWLWAFVGNLAGLGGLAAGLKPASAPLWRFWIGVLLAFFGQAYVGLAFAAWVAAWTRLASARPDVFGVVLWPVAFLVVAWPVWWTLISARIEAREENLWRNPGIEALHFSTLAIIGGFLVFAVFPAVAAAAWPWVPLVLAAAKS